MGGGGSCFWFGIFPEFFEFSIACQRSAVVRENLTQITVAVGGTGSIWSYLGATCNLRRLELLRHLCFSLGQAKGERRIKGGKF